MTLDTFIKDHRAELIMRARAKVKARSSPSPDVVELEHGVPLFLSQLSATLTAQGLGGVGDSTLASHAAHPTIGESASRHGRDLLKFGFTIDQVVHDYGDVCQAVTELAEEYNATLSVAEFHTLNRCLDNAIAGAVSAWSDERERKNLDAANRTADAFTRDLQRLIDQATTAFNVLREGRVAVGGATGDLLHRALVQMRAMVDAAKAK